MRTTRWRRHQRRWARGRRIGRLRRRRRRARPRHGRGHTRFDLVELVEDPAAPCWSS